MGGDVEVTPATTRRLSGMQNIFKENDFDCLIILRCSLRFEFIAF